MGLTPWAERPLFAADADITVYWPEVRPCYDRPLDPPFWSFDVETAQHDDLKETGYTKTTRSRVVIDRQQVPVWEHAYADAACMAVAIHGGMPISVLPRY